MVYMYCISVWFLVGVISLSQNIKMDQILIYFLNIRNVDSLKN